MSHPRRPGTSPHSSMMRPLFMMAVWITFVSCPGQVDVTRIQKQNSTSSMGPENTLANFIEMSFYLKEYEGLHILISMTTDQAQLEFEEMTEQDFEYYFKERKLEFMDFGITDLFKVDNSTIMIEYRLGFWDNTPGSSNVQYANHNRAKLVRRGDSWKIAEIEFIRSIAAFMQGRTIQVYH